MVWPNLFMAASTADREDDSSQSTPALHPELRHPAYIACRIRRDTYGYVGRSGDVAACMQLIENQMENWKNQMEASI